MPIVSTHIPHSDPPQYCAHISVHILISVVEMLGAHQIIRSEQNVCSVFPSVVLLRAEALFGIWWGVKLPNGQQLE